MAPLKGKRKGLGMALDKGGAVAEEADGRDGLGEAEADRDEDGAGARNEGHGDFDVLIAATETEAALGQVFADGDSFLIIFLAKGRRRPRQEKCFLSAPR